MHNIETGLTSQQVKDRIALGEVNVASLGSSRSLGTIARADNAWTGDQAHTATMIVLSIASLWVLALHSTPVTAPRIAIFTGMLALCAALFNVPWVGGFFGFVPPATSQLLLVLAIGFAVNACVSVASKLLKTS